MIKVGVIVNALIYGGVEKVVENYFSNYDREKYEITLIIQDNSMQNHIDYFKSLGFNHHCGGHGVAGVAGAVGAEDVGPGIFPAEDGPLAEQGQTAHGGGAAGPHGGIGDDLVEESQVDGVVIPVEGHRADVDGGVDQLCRADLRRGGGIQHRLGLPGQVDPQILDAVLIPAGVGDLLGMDGQGAPQILGPALHGIVTAFTHGNTS